MNTWVISDTHFGHTKMIGYANRPFRDVSHMNTTMMERWYERVRPDDLVYHLGDVGFLRSASMEGTFVPEEDTRSIIQSLPGRKILILGNHDKSAKTMMSLGFDFACESAIIDVPEMHGGQRVYLNHYPTRELPKDISRDGPSPTWVLHGHVHNSTAAERVPHEHKGELINIPNHNINCCVELWNYEPTTIQHIIKSHIHRIKNNELQKDPMRYLQS